MKIRCLVKQEGDLYIAMSLDFGLSAQGSSVKEVKNKLEAQIGGIHNRGMHSRQRVR